jgi:hypothetical protein
VDDARGGAGEEYDAAKCVPIGHNNDDNVYPMHSCRPQGIALIINNEKFSPPYPERSGTNTDALALVELFQWLMFDVEREDNLKAQGIEVAVKDLTVRDHSRYKCVIVAILSYGAKDDVYGTDNKAVSVQKLMEYFQECTSLFKKPKLFFIQACPVQADGQAEADSTPTPTPTPTKAVKVVPSTLAEVEADSPLATLPVCADFLLSYATTPGCITWTKPDACCLYIESLVEVITQCARKDDLLHMLTKVNQRINDKYKSTHMYTGELKIPGLVSQLTKTLKFF